MNKKEIVERISEKTGFTKKDCALMLDVFLETTTQ